MYLFQTWVDLKKNYKSKLSADKKYQAATGGGPPCPPPNTMETKLMEIISEVAVTGNSNITESEVYFDFGSDHNLSMETDKCVILEDQICEVVFL